MFLISKVQHLCGFDLQFTDDAWRIVGADIRLDGMLNPIRLRRNIQGWLAIVMKPALWTDRGCEGVFCSRPRDDPVEAAINCSKVQCMSPANR
ncbi:hypothetical protein C9E81_14735 [Paracoccus alkanivorans]|uniref:Uncharacterized protein n=1 Tax=Paracoccus alkanivorans TaxID=2116655 RepID=A0A3M0M9C5_9RHOB|nr:hypothetical protein C9E81_14735 [Paracoccus alkanivorans]